MAPDKVCTIIVACVVLHNMAIVWKQPMLEDLVIDQHKIDEIPAIEETGYWLPSITEINLQLIILVEYTVELG